MDVGNVRFNVTREQSRVDVEIRIDLLSIVHHLLGQPQRRGMTIVQSTSIEDRGDQTPVFLSVIVQGRRIVSTIAKSQLDDVRPLEKISTSIEELSFIGETSWRIVVHHPSVVSHHVRLIMKIFFHQSIDFVRMKKFNFTRKVTKEKRWR